MNKFFEIPAPWANSNQSTDEDYEGSYSGTLFINVNEIKEIFKNKKSYVINTTTRSIVVPAKIGYQLLVHLNVIWVRAERPNTTEEG